MKVLRTISLRLARKTDSLRQRSDRPSLCCKWWHENIFSQWLRRPVLHSCFHVMPSSVISALSIHLLILLSLLTSSSLDHEIERQTTETSNTLSFLLNRSETCYIQNVATMLSLLLVKLMSKKLRCGTNRSRGFSDSAHGTDSRLCGILKEINMQHGQPLFQGLFSLAWP